MTDLLPDPETVAAQALEAAQGGQRVYIEGPVGAGRNSLFAAIARQSDQVVPLELLPLLESDSAAVALLEVGAQLGSEEGWPRWGGGSEGEYHALARSIGEGLAEAGRVLVIRMPDNWAAIEGARLSADALPARARSVLDGFFQSRATTILVADAAITPAVLGYHAPSRFKLAPHHTPMEALGSVPWGPYQGAFEELLAHTPSQKVASPLDWRLAVGARALGADRSLINRALVSQVPLRRLADLLVATVHQHPALRASVQRFLGVRRPVRPEVAVSLSGVPEEHIPLIVECIGYGTSETRVSTVLRTILTKALGGASEGLHATCAEHYARADGARSPEGLTGLTLRSWCEKAHHLAHAGVASEEAWSKLDLVAPSLYWDRGRYLSQEARDFSAAARVYEQCVRRFPKDDYGWHYLAFNLERASGFSDSVKVAFRRAVELNPEHPWWNSRLITSLIRAGHPGEAQEEWRLALDRVDPEGSQIHSDDWLARSFLANLEHRPGLGSTHADLVRSVWSKLAEAEADLPLPMADRTADETAFQFAWSFASVLLEAEVSEGGEVYWYGNDRILGKSEDGSFTVPEPVPAALKGWLEKVANA